MRGKMSREALFAIVLREEGATAGPRDRQVCDIFSPPFQEKAAAMRFSFARSGLVLSSLVLLSGCYSNGKMHAPTWSDMAFWKKDKTPASSSLAGPSVTRPSEEASLAAKGSPGEKAGVAPSYEGSPASYNAAAGKSTAAPAGSPSASASAMVAAQADRYPSTGAPVVTPGAPSSNAGGTNWSSNGPTGNVAASTNAYAGGNSAGGNAYNTSSRYDAPAGSGAAGGAAQTSPYDTNYQGGSSYTGGSMTARDAGPANSGASSAAIAGAHENPYYRDSASTGPSGGSRNDAQRYDSSNGPSSNGPSSGQSSGGPSGDRYGNDRYSDNSSAGRAAGDEYDSAKYRESNGVQYADERGRSSNSRDAAPAANRDARSYDSGNDRTADSRNIDSRGADSRGGDGNFDPGRTGYQPKGTPSYDMPANGGSIDARTSDSRSDSRSSPSYQPGGTSRYQAGSSRASDSYNTEAPARRYEDAPAGEQTRRY